MKNFVRSTKFVFTMLSKKVKFKDALLAMMKSDLPLPSSLQRTSKPCPFFQHDIGRQSLQLHDDIKGNHLPYKILIRETKLTIENKRV